MGSIGRFGLRAGSVWLEIYRYAGKAAALWMTMFQENVVARGEKMDGCA
jgi:hypothetical protein